MAVISSKDYIIVEQLEEIRSKELQEFKYKIGAAIKEIINKQNQILELQKQVSLCKVYLKELQLEQTPLNVLD